MTNIFIRFKYTRATLTLVTTTYDANNVLLRTDTSTNITVPSKMYINILYTLNPNRSVTPIKTPKVMVLEALPTAKVLAYPDYTYGQLLDATYGTSGQPFGASMLSSFAYTNMYSIRTLPSKYYRSTIKLFPPDVNNIRNFGIVVSNLNYDMYFASNIAGLNGTLIDFLNGIWGNAIAFSINIGLNASVSIIGTTWGSFVPTVLASPMPIATLNSTYITTTIFNPNSNSRVIIEYTDSNLVTTVMVDVMINTIANYYPSSISFFTRNFVDTYTYFNIMHVPAPGF